MGSTFKKFQTRFFNWEYWPLPVIYIPVYIYWFYLSLRARSFFFFSASNPGIEYGGMLGESKKKIMEILPDDLIPVTVYLPESATAANVISEMEAHQLSFPIILKPDIGERGWQVEKIENNEALEAYMESSSVPILLQAYIDFPLELGVFYYRYPGEKKGMVTSIVEKEMLKVEGDGNSTVSQLLNQHQRGSLQLDRLIQTKPKMLAEVPGKGVSYLVEPIGNHSLGTAFVDATAHINDKIRTTFDRVSLQIEGFYFGRFDLRCKSYEALEEGSMMIMELNGAGAEPAHIYQSGYSIWVAYRVLLSHWKALFEIAVENHKNGIPYLSFSEGVAVIKSIRKYNKAKRA
jgi:hypothetical protein